MTTTYTCPRHGDYTSRDVELLDWMPIRALKTTCPSCMQEAESAQQEAQREYKAARALWKRWSTAQIPTRYLPRTLGNWRPQKAQEEAARMIKGWAAGMWERAGRGEGLLLMGAPGVGKTHLLAGLTTAAVQMGVPARYASWPEVWNRCRPPYTDQHPEEILRELTDAPFLALDELGVRAASEKEQARLFELIDARYSNELPTMVATNATMANLNTLGERTADRLREMCIPVVIPGTSYRQKAATDEALRDAAWPIQEPMLPTLQLVRSVDGQDQVTEWRAKEL